MYNIWNALYSKQHFNAITFRLANDDPAAYNALSQGETNLIRMICAARWMCRENCDVDLINKLKIPASQSLINMVAAVFGGHGSTQWQSLAKTSTCIFEQGQLSQIILMFLLVSTKCPGGKMGGECGSACLKIVAFLSCPEQRIRLVLAGAFALLYGKCAKFFDRQSELSGACYETYSTKMRETVIFERSVILTDLNMICADWKAYFPDAAAFLSSESERAVNIGKYYSSPNQCVSFFDSLMKEAAKESMALGLKYFRDPWYGCGYCLLLVLDPFVGPAVAGAILEAMHILKLIAIKRKSSKC